MSKQSDWNDAAMWSAFNEFHYRCDTHRFQKLFARADLVKMIAKLPGDIIDAGTYKGTSTLQFAHALETYQPNSRSRVLAFDTFEATFPRTRTDEQATAEHHMQTYEASAYETLLSAIHQHGLTHRVEVIRGDIVETLPALLAKRPGLRVSLLHCDLDVYAPTLTTLNAVWPRLVRGGLAVFDEYAVDTWGESDAVDEFLATLEHPPLLKMLPATPTPTAYCIKA